MPSHTSLPQVKLKEIISRLDARLQGFEGSAGDHQYQGQEEEEEDYVKEQEGRGRNNSSRSSASTMSPRCTVLLSATLHQELGALATAIQRNPVPVGFSLQKV